MSSSRASFAKKVRQICTVHRKIQICITYSTAAPCLPRARCAIFCREIVEKTQPSSTGIIRKTCTGHMCLTALTLIAAPIRTSEHSVPCLHHTVRDRPTGRPRPCFRECPPASRRNLRLGPRKLRVKRGGAAQDVAVAVPQLSCNLKCWQRGYCVGQIM